MCARPRSIPDFTIAEHACSLLIEYGPQAVTFAEVSQRCGLAPPTLVQRFGSRAGLLEAAAVALRQRVITAFESAARDGRGRQLDQLGVTLGALSSVQWAATLLSSAVGLAAFSNELRKQISFQLAVALDAGELPRCDIAQLARTLQITFSGAVVAARLERGEPAAEVGEAIASQLSAYV